MLDLSFQSADFLQFTSTKIGNTPCVKLNDRMAPKGRTIYVKLEYFNPLGSVKESGTEQWVKDGESIILKTKWSYNELYMLYGQGIHFKLFIHCPTQSQPQTNR